jgi:hypothetical protein
MEIIKYSYSITVLSILIVCAQLMKKCLFQLVGDCICVADFLVTDLLAMFVNMCHSFVHCVSISIQVDT